MEHVSFRRCLGGLLFLLSIPFAIWGFMPQRSSMQRITLKSPTLQGQTVIVEISVPYLMRLGESAKLQVTISLDMLDSPLEDRRDDLSIQDTGSAEVGNPTILTRVRFELARLPVIPTGELIGTFSDNAPGVFLWQINAEEPGEYPGRIWLYTQPQSIMPNSEDLILSEPLTVQPIKFRVASFLGLRLEFIKLLGVVGLAFAGLLLGDLLLAFPVMMIQNVRKLRS